jgi:hypothetical protein
MDAKTLASRAYEARKQGLTELAEKIENEAKSRGGDIYGEFLSKLAHEKAKGAINAEDIVLNNGRKISAKNTKEGLDVNNRDTTLKAITDKASNDNLISSGEASQWHQAYAGIKIKDDKAAVIRAIVAGLTKRNDGGEALELLYKTAKTAEDRALIATAMSNLANSSSISKEERDRLKDVIKSQKDISKIADTMIPEEILNEITAAQTAIASGKPYDANRLKGALGVLKPGQLAQLSVEILANRDAVEYVDPDVVVEFFKNHDSNARKDFVEKLNNLKSGNPNDPVNDHIQRLFDRMKSNASFGFYFDKY